MIEESSILIQALSSDLEAFVLNYRRLMLEDYEPYGLSVTMMVVVAAVAQGATTLTVLAQQVRMSLPQAALALNKLEERGFIDRNVESRDKRKMALSLTEAGRAMINHVQRQREQRLQGFYDSLSQEESTQFARWFAELRRCME